jgi:hypothetical protein
MDLRALLLGTAAAALMSIGSAAAQTGSVTAGGSASGGISAGGTGAGTSTMTGSTPTQLLPQGGVGGGQIQRSLSGLPEQGGTQGAQDAAGSGVTDFGADAGPIATTPTPMNAPSTVTDTGGARVFTPTPLNAPALGSTAVPPLSGSTVPPLSGDTVPVQGLENGTGTDTRLVQGGIVRSNGQLLSARQAAQQQLRARQNQAGAQVIILSGSVFQGTTDRPNVVVVPTGQGRTGQARGLTAQSVQRGEQVLQGTVEAPRVIALAPSPGNILVVQGSQLGTSGAGQVRAQIVELPAE